MSHFKFEHKITFVYLIIGSLWIIFSDRILNSVIHDQNLLTEIQTYKGWFYVIITGLLFYIFLKKHLNILRTTEKELERHQNNLEELIEEKIKDLNDMLKELHEKNIIINNQNRELQTTLNDFKETQSQLLQSEKMASIGVLTAGVAHEINNPLNFIKGAYVGLNNYFEQKNIKEKKISKFLDSLNTGINRASKIVSGLNEFSRDNKTYDEDCDIHTILDNCLLILNPQIQYRIQLKKRYNKDKLMIKGNIGKLHQVFINVLLNAIQSIRGNGQIIVHTSKKNDKITAEIIDNGIGIKQEDLPKITDPFFTTKEPGKGTGLGLSITYKLIKELNGELEFESSMEKGTKVKIRFRAYE